VFDYLSSLTSQSRQEHIPGFIAALPVRASRLPARAEGFENQDTNTATMEVLIGRFNTMIEAVAKLIAGELDALGQFDRPTPSRLQTFRGAGG
jgi:hypothetical protein